MLRDPDLGLLHRRRWLLVASAIVAWVVIGVWFLDGDPPSGEIGTEPYQVDYVPEVEEGLGIAVAIVVDNSRSMASRVGDDREPKQAVARRSIEEMLAATDSFAADHPDMPVKVALFRFNEEPTRLLEIQPYEGAVVSRAMDGMPKPGGGTAMGLALEAALEELYRSGALRKHILMVTDGENTSGPDPALVAEEIFQRSGQSVRFHFVAFDTDPEKFGFLESVQGTLLAAADAATLRMGLGELYRGGILAEAVDPAPDTSR